MLTGLFRKTEYALASLASAINVRFSVAYTITLQSEECRNTFDKAEEIVVFLAALV